MPPFPHRFGQDAVIQLSQLIATIDARPLGSKEDTLRVPAFVTGESKISLSSCGFFYTFFFFISRWDLTSIPLDGQGGGE